MKTRLNTLTSLFAVSLLALAGLAAGTTSAIAAPATRSSAVSYDGSLTEQVRHNLAMLPWIGVFDNLQFEVNGNEVTLEGQVVNDVTKHDAENVVKRLEGVSHVVNNIQVLPLSTFDNQIRRAEYRAIYSQPQLSRYSMGAIPQIHIIVDGGHVTLEGFVANEMDRNVAGILANGVSGVFSVTNNLRVG